MVYGINTPGYQQTPTNNLWFGNNYAAGYSQASRSMNQPMSPNSMVQPMQNIQQQVPNQIQSMNNILQTMGPESADKFMVGPNSHVILMDSNRPVFYTKHSDDLGYSETKAYAFHEIPLYPEQDSSSQNKTTPQINPDEYVTKKELDEFKKTIENFKKMIEELGG